MAKKMLINSSVRKTAQVVLQNVVKRTYFKHIPINDIDIALQDMEIVMVQEDNTEWTGMFCGDQGECFIRLAPMNFNINKDGVLFYTPYENTGLRLTWYRCESRKDRKFEVIAYIT